MFSLQEMQKWHTPLNRLSYYELLLTTATPLNLPSGVQRTKRSTATFIFHGETAAAAKNDIGDGGASAPETDPASHCQTAPRLQTAGADRI